jgi:hypothetical protein
VELAAGTNADVAFVLSPRPAAVHGTVQEGDKPVAGVPVYLTAEGLEPRMTRTDTAGRYEFYGLAPGRYRVVASFDGCDTSEGRSIEIQEGQDQAVDPGLSKAQ